MFAGFLLVVNTYAWFVFITKIGANVNVSVAKWSIDFRENDNVIQNLDIIVSNIYPDMDTFTKEIDISNQSEVDAKFDAYIEEVNILGRTYTYEENSFDTQGAYQKIKDDYPFDISISPFSYNLDISEQKRFAVSISWPFENPSGYFKVNDLITYSDSYTYYIYNGTSYVKTDISTAEYNSLVANGNLYIDGDDADSFFGSECGKYQQQTGNSCLRMKIKLVVSQRE